VKILKSTWHWPLFVILTSVLLIFMGVMGTSELTMDHIWNGLGNPDPWLMLLMMFYIALAFFFAQLSAGQNKSTVMLSNVGRVSLHSKEPVALQDPLDYYKIEPTEAVEAKACEERRMTHGSEEYWQWRDEYTAEVRGWMEEKRKGFYLYEHYLPEEDIKKVCDRNRWERNGPEIKQWLAKYRRQIHKMLPMGGWPDGGVSFLQWEGGRFFTGGFSSLTVGSPEFMLWHGDGLVCLAGQECFLYGEQLEKLPVEAQCFALDHFPALYAGKHTISYYTEPHPKAVRARVLANEGVSDDEALERPKWVWSLPLDVGSNINYEMREKYLESVKKEVQKEVDKLNTHWKKWQKKQREKEEHKEATVEKEEQGAIH